MLKLRQLLRALFRRDTVVSEIDDELRQHEQLLAERFEREGMTRQDAWREARRRLGNRAVLRDAGYDVRGGGWIEALLHDLRDAARLLRRRPGFTVAAVAILSLGIGANTAMFSLAYAVLADRLPYHDADRLVLIWNVYNGTPSSNSPPDYLDRVEQSRTLQSLAAFRPASFNLTGTGDPERLDGVLVTASFFPMMGVQPLQGRWLLPEEDAPERADAVVLSCGAWRRRFGGQPVVGSTIVLNDRTYRIAGVMPERFSLLFPNADLWAPIAFTADDRADANRGNENLSVMARLADEATIAQAQQEMAAIAARAVDSVPERRDFLVRNQWSAAVVSLREQYAGDVRAAVLVLFAGVLAVLLIACANVANLLLARGAARARELTIRAALGAGRRRIVRQLLVEHVSLAIAGGVPGVVLAWWGVRAIEPLTRDVSPLMAQAGLNLPSLAFAATLMLATGVIFGLVPAVNLSRLNLRDGLKDGARTAGRGLRRGPRALLVIAEVALAVVLLVSAGLLLRSLQQVRQVHPGFETTNRLTFRISLPSSRYASADTRRVFHRAALERLRQIPGVTAAGNVQSLPIAGTVDTATYHVEGYEPPAGAASLSAEYRMISPGYLCAMGIPLRRGRDVQESDGAAQPRVVLIDERTAERLWPGEDPIGKRVGFGAAAWRDVVGVVGSVRNRGLDVSGRDQIYIPYLQSPQPNTYYVVLADRDAGALMPALRAVIRDLDPRLPVFDVQSMEARLGASVAPRRLSAGLLTSFAGVAALLAAIGIYGLLAYLVRLRAREIGLRLALGARRGRVFRDVVATGMGAVGIGLAIGIAGAAAATRLLERLLFGVTPHDVSTFSVVVALIAIAAFTASAIPALRATRIDPAVTLREE
jgi:predicted permease